MNPKPGEITVLLSAIRTGDDEATTKLIHLLYHELHRLAAAYMRRERPNHTLQPTALVHEAYVELIGNQEIEWQNRAHFIGVAAMVMRRILVDSARARRAGKRGGLMHRVELQDESAGPLNLQIAEIIDLDAALNRLAEFDPRSSRIVELRYFGGLSVDETAEVLGVSTKTVKRDWSIAKGWLRKELTGSECGDSGTLERN